MTLLPMRDQTAITGIGWTEFTRGSGSSTAVLAAQAGMMAIEDAGLQVNDIDGIVSWFHRKSDTVHPRDLAAMLGLPECNFHFFHDGGGSWNAAAVLTASMMVYSGICKNVLIYIARNRYSEGRAKRAGDAYDTSGPEQRSAPLGSNHAAA